MQHKRIENRLFFHTRSFYQKSFLSFLLMLLVIFDIDGTLAGEIKSNRLRPHQKQLYDTLRELKMEVGLWTAAGPERLDWYQRSVKSFETQFELAWDVRRVTRKSNGDSMGINGIDRWSHASIRKPLRKVWRASHGVWNRRNVVIVDNTPSTFADNYGNGIAIPTFEGQEKNDVELKNLCHVLKRVRKVFDVCGDVRMVTRMVTRMVIKDVE